MPSIDRRATLRFLLALLGSAATGRAEATPSDFRAIYGDWRLRKRFYRFLTNVFQLYPADRSHPLSTDVSKRYLVWTDEFARRVLDGVAPLRMHDPLESKSPAIARSPSR